MKKVITVFAIIIFVPVILCAGIYLYIAWQYHDTYMNGVMINGIYAAGMTPEEVNDLLVQKTEDATFSIIDKSGKETEIPIMEMDYRHSYMDDLDRILDKQNPLMWGIKLADANVENETIEPKGTCDEKKLRDYLDGLDLIKNQADPEKVRVEIVRSKDGYQLIDETKNLLDVDLTIQTIVDAVLNGDTYVNLAVSDCYIPMEYTAGMKKTLRLWKKIDALQSIEIVCRFYDGDETVDASVISSWLLKDDKDDFSLDDDGNLMIDEEAVAQTVEKWANKHDSAGGPWQFNPTRGGTVTIEKGNYGYKLDQKKQKEYLLGLLKDKKSDKSEAIYSQRGYGKGSNDIGDTYIEVDMTNQTMYYYVNGRIKLQTPVVTGCTGKGNGTPQRVCYVYFMQRNRVLIGEDYRTPVSYWIAVYNNIGIHDASWRSKFGGEIYKTSGSHGCINTPTSEVSRLYDMVEVGTPVILFY
ncbi:MAG: L,D-transpeptidase [Lachnospiraceae bacterium]|nr:L,D-transpeptidase [Lachnospiraceae bacterium]MDD5853287.1 L,D-transpeptidase [Lachnospiraceae bacterium]